MLTEDYDACTKLAVAVCQVWLEWAPYQVGRWLFDLLYFLWLCTDILFLQVHCLELAQADEDKLKLTKADQLRKDAEAAVKAKDEAIKAKAEAKVKLKEAGQV